MRDKGADGSIGFRLPARLKENIISMFVLQGATYVLPLITVPYLVRVLGPSEYGELAFAQAFIAYFTIFVDYGFNLSATRRIALIRNDPDRLSRFVASVMTIKIVLAAIGFFVVFAVSMAIPRFAENRTLYLFTYVAVVGSVVFPLWLYRGLEAMKLMSILTIAGRAVSVVGIFLFVHQRGDMLTAALIQSSAMLLSGISALIMLRYLAPMHLVFPAAATMWETLLDGWYAFLSTSAILLYTSTNTFVLGLMVSPMDVGYYAAACKIISAVSGLVSPVSQAVYPHIVGLIAQSRDQALDFIGRLFWFQGVATFVLSIVLFVFAGMAVRILLGPQFLPCLALVRIMAFIPFVIGISNVLGIQTMMPFDMKKVFSRIIGGCGLLNLVVLFPFISYAGTSGAAWAVLTVETVVTGTMAIALMESGMLGRIVKYRVSLGGVT